MDATKWPRNARIVELFCGRGSGLRALHQLGFREVEGIDLSPSLAAEYAGPGKILVGDAGGFHLRMPAKIFSLSRRPTPFACASRGSRSNAFGGGARPEGRWFTSVVEPWATLFLSVSHAFCRSRIIRTLLPKLMH